MDCKKKNSRKCRMYQILLTTMADEMQGIIRGLQKLGQELNASEKDGPISEGFRSVRHLLASNTLLIW